MEASRTVSAILIPVTVALVLFLINRHRRKFLPFYATRSDKIAKELDELDFVHLVYSGDLDDPITNLTRSVIAFWNHGGRTIKGDDLTKMEISFGEGEKILHYDPDFFSSEGTNLQLSVDGSALKISFSHLNHLEGAALICYHTAPPENIKLICNGAHISSTPERVNGLFPPAYPWPFSRWLRKMTPTRRIHRYRTIARAGMLIFLFLSLTLDVIFPAPLGEYFGLKIFEVCFCSLILLAYVFIFYPAFLPPDFEYYWKDLEPDIDSEE